ADSPDDPQRKVHVAQCSSSSHETSGLYNHVRFVERHVWITLAEHWCEPPRRGGALMIEQAGLGHYEGPNAGGRHHRTFSSPPLQENSGISNVGPRECGL